MRRILTNKKIIISLIGLAVLLAVVYIFTPQAAQTPSSGSTLSEPAGTISPVEEVRSGQAVLIDVRTTNEWQGGHAAQAVHFDLARLEAGDLPEGLSRDEKIYLYCAAGQRAGRAKAILIQNGFKNVVNIGGLSDWVALGGVAVYPPSAPSGAP